jgi:hypothetical protein
MQKAMMVIVSVCGAILYAAEPPVSEVTHRQLQEVNANGYGTYTTPGKVTVTGIVLNAPEEMLDPSPSPVAMGGQWQMFIQGEGDDHAGTAVWLGQNYSRVSNSDDYTDQELLGELYRINTDPQTGYVFNVGDRVRVTGFYKFFKGKTNINENHQTDPLFDFTIELIEAGAGLPQAEAVKISQLKDENGFIFDPNRLGGCEYYQGRRIRLTEVTIVDPQNWGAGQTVTVADPNGMTFPVKLGIGEGFRRYACPTGQIDVLGILNQESSGIHICKDGYHVWVTHYDGNGLVLGDRGYRRGNMAGDVNGDFRIDLLDLAAMSERWMQGVYGLYVVEPPAHE